MSMARKLMNKAASSKASKNLGRSKAPQGAVKASVVEAKTPLKKPAVAKPQTKPIVAAKGKVTAKTASQKKVTAAKVSARPAVEKKAAPRRRIAKKAAAASMHFGVVGRRPTFGMNEGVAFGAAATTAAGVAASEGLVPRDTIIKIPPEQYDLPVAFDHLGNILTLRQMLEHGSCIESLSSLEPMKLAELATQRIAARPDFEIAMVGAGLVNKARALKEVAAQTDVGRLLVEIEQRVIQRVLNRARPYFACYEYGPPVETEQRIVQNVYE